MQVYWFRRLDGLIFIKWVSARFYERAQSFCGDNLQKSVLVLFLISEREIIIEPIRYHDYSLVIPKWQGDILILLIRFSWQLFRLSPLYQKSAIILFAIWGESFLISYFAFRSNSSYYSTQKTIDTLMYIVQCTMYNVQCTVYSVHCHLVNQKVTISSIIM